MRVGVWEVRVGVKAVEEYVFGARIMIISFLPPLRVSKGRFT